MTSELPGEKAELYFDRLYSKYYDYFGEDKKNCTLELYGLTVEFLWPDDKTLVMKIKYEDEFEIVIEDSFTFVVYLNPAYTASVEYIMTIMELKLSA